MNFFEHQAQARSASTRMLWLFALAVAGIVLFVDIAVLFTITGDWPVRLFFVFLASVGTLAVIGFGSLYRIATLRSGGDAVAMQMGATAVAEDTADPSLRRLRNVVEEIAIASGTPVPRLYVMEQDAGINAFAAGYTPADAAIAVTRGALDRLNRDELQGVIAHEFSHVVNGDMRLNLRMMGVLFGILMLGIIGTRVLQFGGGRGKNGGPILAASLVFVVVGSVGVFFGRMIKASVSRQRELLADASAVQFTRQTDGLAGALKKIAGLPAGSALADKGKAEEVSHMLFGEGASLAGAFATHPPIAERIRLLDPSFDPSTLDALRLQWAQSPPDGLQEDAALGLVGGGAPTPTPWSGPPPLPPLRSESPISPTRVADRVGIPDSADYARAGTLVATLPAALRTLATQRDHVPALLLGLLLDTDPTVAARQRALIAQRLGDAVATEAEYLQRQELGPLHPMLRLPLAALAFPVLRRRPRPDLDAFLDTVEAVVHADGAVSLFEYCLGRLLQVQVREAMDPGAARPTGRRKPAAVRNEFATLLAVVASVGSQDPAEAQRAYLAGMQRVLPRDHVLYAPPSAGVSALDAVWEPLDALDPLAKQVVVEAVTAAIRNDGRIDVAEAELLRTICAVLHCPLPPVLEA